MVAAPGSHHDFLTCSKCMIIGIPSRKARLKCKHVTPTAGLHLAALTCFASVVRFCGERGSNRSTEADRGVLLILRKERRRRRRRRTRRRTTKHAETCLAVQVDDQEEAHVDRRCDYTPLGSILHSRQTWWRAMSRQPLPSQANVSFH